MFQIHWSVVVVKLTYASTP